MPEGAETQLPYSIVIILKGLNLNLNLSTLRNQIKAMCSLWLIAVKEKLFTNSFSVLWLPSYS